MKTPQIVANHEPAVKEIHVLWTPDGLSCDGDTISVTAASLPSIEDLVMGAIPGLPKVHLHNRVLAAENATDFMKAWFAAAEGKLDPFVLVGRGFDPQRRYQGRRLLGRDRHRSGRRGSRSRLIPG